jgi:hypothetical protein
MRTVNAMLAGLGETGDLDTDGRQGGQLPADDIA